jgi:hypothetical protein
MRVVALVLTLSLCAPGCTLDRGTLTLHLVRSPRIEQDPLPDPQPALDQGLAPEVASLRVRVEGDDIGVIEQTFSFTHKGDKAVLPQIEVGSGRVFTVEGLTPEGLTFSRGTTVPLEIQPGDNSLTLFMGRASRFSQTPVPMRTARAFHAAVLLGDGRLVLMGGATSIDREAGSPFVVTGATSTAEVLDSTSVLFDTTPLDCGIALPRDCLMHPRALATATAMPTGVLLAGGEDEAGPLGDAELFDPGARLFSPGGTLVQARSRHVAALLGAGVELIGGRGATGLAGTVERFEGGRFRPGPAALPREAAAATGLADGRILITGGRDEAGEVAVAEILDGESVAQVGSLVRPRAYHTATLLADGRVLLLGGLAQTQGVNTAEVFDPQGGAFTEVDATMLDRWAHTATMLPDGRVLVAGGFGGGVFGVTRREVDLLDPAHLESGEPGPLGGLSVTHIVPLAEGRAGHSATALGNGFVLVAGGLRSTGASLGTQVLDSAEVLVLER